MSKAKKKKKVYLDNKVKRNKNDWGVWMSSHTNSKKNKRTNKKLYKRNNKENKNYEV